MPKLKRFPSPSVRISNAWMVEFLYVITIYKHDLKLWCQSYAFLLATYACISLQSQAQYMLELGLDLTSHSFMFGL